MNRHIYGILFFVSLMASGLVWGMDEVVQKAIDSTPSWSAIMKDKIAELSLYKNNTIKEIATGQISEPTIKPLQLKIEGGTETISQREYINFLIINRYYLEAEKSLESLSSFAKDELKKNRTTEEFEDLISVVTDIFIPGSYQKLLQSLCNTKNSQEITSYVEVAKNNISQISCYTISSLEDIYTTKTKFIDTIMNEKFKSIKLDKKNALKLKDHIKEKNLIIYQIKEYAYEKFIEANKSEKESTNLVEYVSPFEEACLNWIEKFVENWEITQDEVKNEISDQKSNELTWHLVGEDGNNYSYRLKNEKIFGTYCARTKFDILITDQRNDKNLNLVYSTIKKEINFYEVKDNKESYEVSDDDKNNLINLLKSFANYFYSSENERENEVKKEINNIK